MNWEIEPAFPYRGYANNYQSDFFNNCDQNVIWGQMQTITDETAHSGTKSSSTGNGNDYSITWKYPLKFIPDSIKKHITIEFWAYQTSAIDNAKIVIEARGNAFKNYGNGMNLKHDINAENKWINYHKNISIPDSIKDADLIKIYVYNPSTEKMFIDDFKINITE